MIEKIPTGMVDLEMQDKKWPLRHEQIHKACCRHCPTNNNRLKGIKDQETEDIKGLPKDLIAREYLFVCAWRPNKLCKGICDEYGIDEQFIGESKPKQAV